MGGLKPPLRWISNSTFGLIINAATESRDSANEPLEIHPKELITMRTFSRFLRLALLPVAMLAMVAGTTAASAATLTTPATTVTTPVSVVVHFHPASSHW